VLSLLARIAASVPPPKLHVNRSRGVLAPASSWCPFVIPPYPCFTRLRRASHRTAGRMKLRALVRDEVSIERFLRRKGR